ncbi:MAG: o-succinylbenzoate synthase [Psittacicella sp.]
MRDLKIYKYSLNVAPTGMLKSGVKSGYIIHISLDSKEGFGEISPLNGFSEESLNEALFDLVNNAKYFLGNQDFNFKTNSVAFGFSMALAEVLNGPLEASKFITTPLLESSENVIFDRDLNLKNYQDFSLKLKIGRGDRDKDLELIRSLITKYPNIKLRLDSNSKFSMLDFLKDYRGILDFSKNIEYLEEPCFSIEESVKLSKCFDIPIAADESFIKDPYKVFDNLKNVKYFILKPTLLGNIFDLTNNIKKYDSLGVKSVFSSSLESSLALTQLNFFAQKYTKLIPGLGTSHLYNKDLIRSIRSSVDCSSFDDKDIFEEIIL